MPRLSMNCVTNPTDICISVFRYIYTLYKFMNSSGSSTIPFTTDVILIFCEELICLFKESLCRVLQKCLDTAVAQFMDSPSGDLVVMAKALVNF